LWAQGKADAAIHHQRLWEDLANNYDIDVQCWSVSGKYYRDENNKIFEEICGEHSAVYSH
jgi:hypothetical protein